MAHACVLQPFVTCFRAHTRLPLRTGLLLALLEGAAVVSGMAMELDFDASALAASPSFLAAALFLFVGLLLALVGLVGKIGGASGRERAATGDDMASPPLEGLFINENKYQLSPASKRLLQ